MPKVNHKIYSTTYTTVQLQEAVGLVRAGRISQRAAAKRYGIPQSTISDHVLDKIQQGAKPGRKPALPIDVEDALVHQAMAASERGFGITRQQLLARAGRLCNSMKWKTSFKNNVPGKDWFLGLKRRHPNFTLRTPEPLSTKRSKALNPIELGKYFTELGEVLSELQLHGKPQLIWNMDETNSKFEHKPSKVCARKGTRDIPGRTGNSKQGVTVLATINGAGRTIPPLVIVKGVSRKSLRSYNVVEGIPGTIWTWQKKAWMEDVLGVMWFEEIFLPHCGPERPQLLVMDGHHSHEVLGLLEKARDNDIHILVVPPGTTSKTNPLDVSCFAPLKVRYSRIVTEWMAESPNNVMDKWNWPRLFREAYQSAMTEKNIRNGFRGCGIIPFNPIAIKAVDFLPSAPFHFDDNLAEAPEVGDAHPLEWVARASHGASLVAQGAATPHTTQNDAQMELPYANIAEDIAVQPDPQAQAAVQALLDVLERTDVVPEAEPEAEALLPFPSAQLTAEEALLMEIDTPQTWPQHDTLMPGTHVFDVIVETEPGSLVDLENMTSITPPSVAQATSTHKQPDWNTEIEMMFQLPQPAPKSNMLKKKQNSSRRLLTSDEIISAKQEERADKLKKEEAKVKRKIIKEEKKNIEIQMKALVEKQKQERDQLKEKLMASLPSME